MNGCVVVSTTMSQPTLVIHGGAGNIRRSNVSKEVEASYREGLKDALLVGHRELEATDSALKAVAAAVKCMEDNPIFNAGKGAVFTRRGHNELEASVMVSKGEEKKAAAVSLLKHVKNPFDLARLLLQYPENPHVLNSGDEAERMAEKFGCEMVSPDYFFTPLRWKQHEDGLNSKPTLSEDMNSAGKEWVPKGTIGATALDSSGTIAVGTSTGGLTNKTDGRIGDTPQAGAGFWAEEFEQPSLIRRMFFMKPKKAAVGLSGTGDGEGFLRNAICHSITERVKYTGSSLKQSAKLQLQNTKTQAGVVGIDESGNVVMAMNCGMNRGFIGPDGIPHTAIFQDESPKARL